MKRIAVYGPKYWSGILGEHLIRRGFCVRTQHGGKGILKSLYFLFWVLWQAAHRSVIHIVGCSSGPKLPRIAHLTRTPLIYHWIGPDFYSFASLPPDVRERAAERLNRLIALHVADSPEAAEILKNVGLHVNGVVRLLPTSVEAQILPLPESPAVMCYWADDYTDFYRVEWILELARQFPAVAFRVAGATGQGLNAPGNMEFLGWQKDLSDLYRHSSIFIRLVKQDSLSAAVLEALARGRYVIYTKELPYCRYVETFEHTKEALGQLLQMKSPNEAGGKWVQEAFNPRMEIDKLMALYKNAGIL